MLILGPKDVFTIILGATLILDVFMLVLGVFAHFTSANIRHIPTSVSQSLLKVTFLP